MVWSTEKNNFSYLRNSNDPVCQQCLKVKPSMYNPIWSRLYLRFSILCTETEGTETGAEQNTLNTSSKARRVPVIPHKRDLMNLNVFNSVTISTKLRIPAQFY